MKKAIILLAPILLLSQNEAMASKTDRRYKASVREPARADQFYPGDPARLEKTIDAYIKDAVPPHKEKPLAIISPHAGYIYSGQICADAFNQAAAHDYDLIVLLGTNHTSGAFRGVSIYPAGGYKTPLGIAEIDDALTAELIDADKDFTFKESVHVQEHSIEVMVPFVQKLFPGAKILPAVVGTPDLDLCTRFGEALAKALRGKNALIVASSDLSHYPEYENAVKADKKTLDAIVKMDPEELRSTIQKQLREGIPNLSTCACGQAPILAAMIAAKRLGAKGARLISYANSGDTPIGNRSRVVGYGAVAFYDDFAEKPHPEEHRPAEPKDEFMLNRHQKKSLLSFARKTIEQFLAAETVPLVRGFDPVLENKKGAFVTLNMHERLRGCIGHMAEDMPLCQVVGYCATQAAFNDRRFSPVTLEELPDIEIEISVLTPFQEVGGVEDIQVGRDGVLIKKGDRSAVYLPSVPVEQGWNREEMLEHLCLKAGLSRNDWKKGARFFTFQAMAFSESDLE
ncbi:MAG: AmmeMemoRadiSam system protein B [Candidatus Latescibacteria bacterium]|nr:AmmeMemoRadiSam system protein B [Candidatus Latescibacterota bacterium]NIO27173.1 AmmeMemoRadiSam system protein B [Candidatus Latescibacterota bacterium]NIO54697.1 AmmeMemoRadiSam system protein B [Candidatus Latescibacterota bacterium]NIT00780.1 AmmeMemoRadiSam system protein B [Candidatus Latescibacterota bacterium]NIT37703.1 AmmeMemoRadiSam system protein B [Candidatus Latescibacterota bacterium]